jgi:serine protease Do
VTEIERLPCPACSEPAPLDEKTCPRCAASLAVDVLLRAPVADGRVRYQVARALQALGPEAPAFAALQSALLASPPVVARGVTRGFAHAALEVLGRHGVRGSIERPQGGGPRAASAGSGARVGGWKTAAAVVLLVMAGTGLQQMWSETSAPAPPPAAPARPAAAGKKERGPLTPRELAQRSLPSTVSLRCRESVGSGFFVTAELILTNAHVLCPDGEAIQVVMSDGKKLIGRPERSDEEVDLGLVRVSGARAKPLELGDVADLAVGDKVMIIGSPVGLEFTVHEGSVSSLQRSAFGVAYVQLDAKVNPGNSGGPVIDNRGRVMGIVTLKHGGAEGIGLALPINYAYSEERRYVPAPGGAESSEAFTQMVARARDESGGETREARAGVPGGLPDVDERALLVGASVDQYRRLVIKVVRMADAPPAFEEVAVKVWNDSEAFCTIKGDVSAWKEIDPGKPGLGLDPKLAAGLKMLGRGRHVYVGESPLRWDLCDGRKMHSGVELELQGANPLGSRLQLRIH